jgi:hypothetical protein
MVVCDAITESCPGRSLDERRLLVAYRTLPQPERVELLRRIELQSLNVRTSQPRWTSTTGRGNDA